jgi:hypothetical protein
MSLQRASTPLLPLLLLFATRSATQEDAPVEDPDLARLRAWAAEIVPQVEELRGLDFLRPVPLVLTPGTSAPTPCDSSTSSAISASEVGSSW